MAEYIEKEALEKRIHTGMNIIEVMQTIMDTPAVDAVEVVRCRECVRWRGNDDGNAAPCSWDWDNKDPDWYCPRAQRRGDGDA